MTSHRFLLFGASGHARAIDDVLRRQGSGVAAVVAPTGAWPSAEVLRTDANGVRWALEHGTPAVVAIGDNLRRLKLAYELLDAGVGVPPIVAHSATIATDARLEAGCVVMEHAHVGPRVVAGTGCIINTAAVVEHDCVLDDGVHCAPRSVLGGEVRCGLGALVGIGASVLPGVRIGGEVRIGAGAVVLGEVPPQTTVAGVPAREVHARSAADDR